MATRDYDVGGKTGTGEYNAELAKIQRANRISSLKIQDASLENNEYLFRNQYGLFECKLCCTHHRSEGSFIAHTYGKQHKRNVERRRVVLARKEAMAGGCRQIAQPKPTSNVPKLQKIGEPTYYVFKQINQETGSLTILFELTYDQIRKSTSPKYRIMSAFEQKVDPPDPRFQYVVFAAQPYNTVAFRIPNHPILEDSIIQGWKSPIFTFQVTIAAPPGKD